MSAPTSLEPERRCLMASPAPVMQHRTCHTTGRPYVDIAVVRAHLDALFAAGMRYTDIADTSGYSSGFISALRHHKQQHLVTPAVADVFLAVQPRPVARPFIDATATVRRIQALAAIGWAMSYLSIRCHFDRTRFEKFLEYPTVSVENHDLVAALYRELSHIKGPSAHARGRAGRKGWPPPIAWDDDTIADPDARPWSSTSVLVDELAVELAVEGNWSVARNLPTAERREVVRILSARGATANNLAGFFDVDQRTIQYDRQHLSRTLVAA